MEKARLALKEWLESVPFICAVKPAAFVFVLLLPLFNVLYATSRLGFFSAFSALLYVIYLFGIVLCFAEGVHWALGTAFLLRFLYYLVYLVRAPRFNYVIFVLLYAFLAVVFFRLAVMHSASYRNGIRPEGLFTEDPAPTPTAAAKGMSFCPHCGTQLSPSASFCPRCGRSIQLPGGGRPAAPAPAPGSVRQGGPGPVPGAAAASGTPRRRQAPAGPVGRVLTTMGSGLPLAFTVLLTVYEVLSCSQWITLGRLGILGFLVSIPGIVICVGCWIAFCTARQRKTGTGGLTMISGGLLANAVIVVLAGLLLVFLGIWFFTVSDGELGWVLPGIGIIVAAVAAVVLYCLYVRGLRLTVVSARAILLGEGERWRTSLFSVVLLILGTAVNACTSLAALPTVRRLSELFSEMSWRFGGSVPGAFLSGLSVTGVGSLTPWVTISSLAVSVLAIVLLFVLRNQQRTAETGGETAPGNQDS